MTAAEPQTPRSLRVAFFGDSICVGQGVSPHLTWATALSRRLSDLAAPHGWDVEVTNPSVNGETTRRALERMPHDIQAFEPDLLTVQFGMNDCNRWVTDRAVPRVSERAFAANLHEIVERGFVFGARVVLLHTNHPTGRTTAPMHGTDLTYQQANRRYNEIVRSVADEHGDDVVLVDVEAAWDAHVGGDEARLLALVLADLLHLSPEGHRLYLDIVAPVYEDAVGALIRARAPVA